MTILVAYGSKRGGTEGLAQMIGDALREAGHDVDVVSAQAAGRGGLDRVDAVIVAGGLYAQRWHGDARRFVRRHGKALAKRPVWLVASGPLDESADDGALPDVPQVAAAAEAIGARGTATFGGYLAADAKGFPASAMARNGKAGDWRSPERVTAWASTVHAELAGA